MLRIWAKLKLVKFYGYFFLYNFEKLTWTLNVELGAIYVRKCSIAILVLGIYSYSCIKKWNRVEVNAEKYLPSLIIFTKISFKVQNTVKQCAISYILWTCTMKIWKISPSFWRHLRDRLQILFLILKRQYRLPWCNLKSENKGKEAW